MIDYSLSYPIFGEEITCPHCRQSIAAITLTDSYICSRHGAFEANSETKELVHLQSGRLWKQWENQWYRQHAHPDGIRFEIHEALDRLYTEGFRATKVIIAYRYLTLIEHYLERTTNWRLGDGKSVPRLYGLPVEFSAETGADGRWDVINFEIEKEPGVPSRYPYFRLLE